MERNSEKRVDELVRGIAECSQLQPFTRGRFLTHVRHPAAREALHSLLRHDDLSIRQGASLNPLLRDEEAAQSEMKKAFETAEGAEALHSGYESLRPLALFPKHRTLVEQTALRWIQDEPATARSFNAAVEALALLRSPLLVQAVEEWLERFLSVCAEELSEESDMEEFAEPESEQLGAKAPALCAGLASLGAEAPVSAGLIEKLITVSMGRQGGYPHGYWALLPLAVGRVPGAARRMLDDLPRYKDLVEAIGPMDTARLREICCSGLSRESLAAFELLEAWDVESEARKSLLDRVRTDFWGSMDALDSQERTGLLRVIGSKRLIELGDGIADWLEKRSASQGDTSLLPALQTLAELEHPRAGELALMYAKNGVASAEGLAASLGSEEVTEYIKKKRGPVRQHLHLWVRLPKPKMSHIKQAAERARLMDDAFDAVQRCGAKTLKAVCDGIAENNDTRGYDVAAVRRRLKRAARDEGQRAVLEKVTLHEDPRIALLALEALDGIEQAESPIKKGRCLDYVSPLSERGYTAVAEMSDAARRFPEAAPSVQVQTRAPSPYKFAWAFAEETMAGLFVGRRLEPAKLTVGEVRKLHEAAYEFAAQQGVAFSIVTPGDWVSGSTDDDEKLQSSLVVGIRLELAYADSGPSRRISLSALQKERKNAERELSDTFYVEFEKLLSEFSDPPSFSEENEVHLVAVGPLSSASLVYGIGKTKPGEFNVYRGQDMKQKPHKKAVTGLLVNSTEQACVVDLEERAHSTRHEQTSELGRARGYYIVPRFD